MKKTIWFICLLMSAYWMRPAVAGEKPVVRIGVLAKMGARACMEQWRPTAAYLDGKMEGLSFEIVPLAYDGIYDAVKDGAVAFILANPSFYVELERWYGVNRIATLKHRCSMGAFKTYGGVVFWRRQQSDLGDWEDLKGKRFMAANEFSLGGWRSVWRELQERGIDPHRDFSSMLFGRTHEDVVNAVLDGEVDAGSVRTDVLEQMAAEGRIRLDDLTVLENRSSDGTVLPFLCSTRLYPEWPMAKLQSTPDALAERLTVALLQMNADAPSALAAKCAGWTIPLNYQPVHACLRDLKIGPYADMGTFSAGDVIRSYWRWLLVAAVAYLGAVIAAIVIFRLNRRIRESNQRLKNEMAERKKTDEALKQAIAVAEAATRAKSDFLANMSHEIRTPMNGVIAAAELVLNEPLPPKLKRYVNIIYTSAHSLLGLINDILDFSKIEAGKMSIEQKPFMLDEVLDRAVNLFFNSASEKGIELLVDIDPDTVRAVVGDPLRLQQVLTNLVGNAVKFTESGGFILIAVKTTQKTDQVATFEFQVKDTGVGIPAPYTERLFQPFTQADASDTRRYEGTGLGLSICKRLVEMMSGRIWVESVVGKGSTFYFTATLARRPADVTRNFDPPDEMRQLRVLVVDDYPESVSLISRMLASFNFETETARSADAAVQKINESADLGKSIGLAVIDWQMPETDGLETVRRIRSVCRSDMPVIMMTALGKEPEQAEGEKIGVCCWLTKPIYPSTLYNAIMDVFGQTGEAKRFASEPAGTDVTVYKNRLQGFRVLVVEDNPTNSEIAVAILESAGMLGDTAENGRVAVEKIGAQAYDAVLMDVQMPEMNGYEATKRIRKELGLVQLPIIAMTAHAMRGDEEKCIKAGMDGYISKPVQQLRLFQLLWRLLKNRRPVSPAMPVDRSSFPVEKMTALPDEIAGIRIRESLDRNGLAPDAYLKIIKGFLENNETTGEAVKNALLKNDYETIAAQAHALKGGAANIGAVEVQECAVELENRMKGNGSKADISSLCDRLDQALSIVLRSISELTGKETEAAPFGTVHPPAPSTLTFSILKRLLDALERSEPKAIRKIMTELAGELEKNTFHELERRIDNYDYEDAKAFIGDMMKTGAGKDREENGHHDG